MQSYKMGLYLNVLYTNGFIFKCLVHKWVYIQRRKKKKKKKHPKKTATEINTCTHFQVTVKGPV